MAITVRVGKLPGSIKEVALDADTSVRAAVSAAELDATDHEIRVNSSTSSLDARLNQGDTVLLVKRIKGNAITVRVGKLPGSIKEVALDADTSVRAAVSAAELDATDHEIRVNSSTAGIDTRLNQGDTVLLVKRIKGNAITVRVGKLPGSIKEVALDADTTVRAAVSAAELDATDHEIRVNSSTASIETRLNQGDTVLLVKRIKGNLV